MISRACATLSDLDFSSDDSSSSEEDEKPKCKTGDFTGLAFWAKLRDTSPTLTPTLM
jgi:hypothetical protein